MYSLTETTLINMAILFEGVSTLEYGKRFEWQRPAL